MEISSLKQLLYLSVFNHMKNNNSSLATSVDGGDDNIMQSERFYSFLNEWHE